MPPELSAAAKNGNRNRAQRFAKPVEPPGVAGAETRVAFACSGQSENYFRFEIGRIISRHEMKNSQFFRQWTASN
jgi:hypothetical protein